jgi:hypothetical protein
MLYVIISAVALQVCLRVLVGLSEEPRRVQIVAVFWGVVLMAYLLGNGFAP